MILLPVDVSLNSGSVPTRPTMVMRARRLGLVVVKVRARVDGRVIALRRAGLRRKDMVVECWFDLVDAVNYQAASIEMGCGRVVSMNTVSDESCFLKSVTAW